jgi:hypothetical protein
MATTPRRLGRRPPKDAPALKLSRLLTGVVPEHPVAADHLAHVKFGLDHNDTFGVCGPTSCDNLSRLVSAALIGQPVAWTQDEVYDLYRRSGNPNFDPVTGADDNGVVMQTMLEAWLHDGAGHDENGKPIRPVAFAQVDVGNDDELEAAVAIFGGVIWGVDLQAAQSNQTDAGGPWDYVPRSGPWGGHAIPCGAYARDRQRVISWALDLETTDAFRRHCLEEAWVVVLPWHLDHPAFLAGIDLGELAAAYRELTDRELPLPAPAPTPTPEPAPVPEPEPAPSSDVPAGCFLAGPFPEDVVAKVERLARRRKESPQEYLTARLRALLR